MIVSTHACGTPGCGLVHTESNHWFLVRVMDDHSELWKWEDAESADLLSDLTAHHFCGQTHALQFLSSEMGSKTDKPEEK